MNRQSIEALAKTGYEAWCVGNGGSGWVSYGQMCKDHPSFANGWRAAAEAIAAEIESDLLSKRNSVSGPVTGTVVQPGDIIGGLHL